LNLPCQLSVNDQFENPMKEHLLKIRHCRSTKGHDSQTPASASGV